MNPLRTQSTSGLRRGADSNRCSRLLKIFSLPAACAVAVVAIYLLFTAAADAKSPYWKTCKTGYRCANAVLPHYFENWRYARAIVRCETGGTYSAWTRGSAGERGWFQIHPVHFGWVDEARLWDVRYNSRIAQRLSRGGRDWSPWTCARYV